MSGLLDAQRSNPRPEAAAGDARCTAPVAAQEREHEGTGEQGRWGQRAALKPSHNAFCPNRGTPAGFLKQNQNPTQFLIRMPELTAGYTGVKGPIYPLYSADRPIQTHTHPGDTHIDTYTSEAGPYTHTRRGEARIDVRCNPHTLLAGLYRHTHAVGRPTQICTHTHTHQTQAHRDVPPTLCGLAHTIYIQIYIPPSRRCSPRCRRGRWQLGERQQRPPRRSLHLHLVRAGAAASPRSFASPSRQQQPAWRGEPRGELKGTLTGGAEAEKEGEIGRENGN